MADIKINQSAVANAVESLLGISSNGTLNRISFNNLIGKNFCNRGLLTKGDADDCKESGIYNLSSGIKNIPADCYWSDLIVFAGYSILQFTYNKNSFKLYVRMYSIGGSETWTSWHTISMV